MTDSQTEKERLLSMLAEIQDQLEELESVLEASFSEQRNRMKRDEQNKLVNTANQLSSLENKYSHFHHISHNEDRICTAPAKTQNLKWAFK
ncbi:hypothetical protein RCG24_03065 [Neobacillus sp. OS1-32]|jgi:ferritin-like metal-binding protein YciE|uniref:Uncharacterized protein n=1 Tax=Neobacillus paridis TaxID=2803862 RepID=A0ABS1TS83_9BACI|nr:MULTISPECIES: hypothetical protein [Neobacillus]MBL4954174.1 hypothetical protein [Neobacillus paridis]WML30901.1 hypothetical protein RCG24_03065 [Neobacillus sp. OS1-32]